MSKNPVSKSKPVKRNEPMHNALKFFLAGCVAEIYLLAHPPLLCERHRQ